MNHVPPRTANRQLDTQFLALEKNRVSARNIPLLGDRLSLTVYSVEQKSAGKDTMRLYTVCTSMKGLHGNDTCHHYR